MINFVLFKFEDRFKYADNLSALLKYIIKNFEVLPKFSDAIMRNFKKAHSISSLPINKGNTQILRFNPLKRNFISRPPPYPSVSSEVTLGATLSVDCSFNTHVDIISIKANGAMRTLILIRRFGYSVFQLKTAYRTEQFSSMLSLYGVLKSTTQFT